MSLTDLTTKRIVTSVIRRKIERIVRHVAESLNPETMFLIGSMHRGTIHDNSDVDLVAVVPKGVVTKNLASKVLISRPHMELPVDLHVYKADEFEKMKDIGGLCFEAFHHGTICYKAVKDDT